MGRGGWCVVLVLFGLATLVDPFSGLQFCGRELADVLALVCNGRGYNMAFRPENNGEPTYERRYKRGIVDECCRRGCSWNTLEAYCSPTPSPTPDNLQIRKRSDHSSKNLLEKTDVTESEKNKIGNKYTYKVNDIVMHNHGKVSGEEEIRHHKRRLFGHISAEGKMRHPNRYFSLTDESNKHQGPSYKHSVKSKGKSLTANDFKRNGFGKNSGESFENSEYADIGFHPGSEMNDATNTDDFMAEIVPSSHELNFVPKESAEETKNDKVYVQHLGERFSSNEKKHYRAEGRIRKETGTGHKDEAGTSSQVGTISPYFLGRTLVLPSSRKAFIPRL